MPAVNTATLALCLAIVLPVLVYVVPSPTERRLVAEVAELNALLQARTLADAKREQAEAERRAALAKMNEADRKVIANPTMGYISPKSMDLPLTPKR